MQIAQDERASNNLGLKYRSNRFDIEYIWLIICKYLIDINKITFKLMILVKVFSVFIEKNLVHVENYDLTIIID